MPKNLIIVESPAKAKTISYFLDKTSYEVVACMGHLRDLPKGTLGIDIENNFEPKYIIPKTKTKIVTNLKKIAKNKDNIILATDEDREGEAIA
ncbi:MAG TPA: toprim domain-containing protein [Candidatus Paceibacterota bacterium]|jgi:DNA topoisomerase-1|nr:toprim domain-containing protein [Candidatus Paceibacterota bacterium]HRV32074.1 toprim domain-containing protein [Candidatus Paceibacterota bacterium]